LALDFEKRSIIETGSNALMIGSYYGILLQSKYFDGMKRYTQPREKMEIKSLIRLTIVLLVWYPITLLNKLSSDQIPNSYLLLFLGSLLPYTVATILIFGFVDEFCLKLKLY